MTDFQLALFGVAITLFSTSLGGLLIVFVQDLSESTKDTMLGFSAGIMLAATSFSLLLPALDKSRLYLESPILSATAVGFFVLVGGVILNFAHKIIPHEHFEMGRVGADRVAMERLWLFILAITIHNIPEGLSVGVSLGTREMGIGLPVSIGIGLQDMPEGFIVAVGLLARGYKMRDAIFVSFVTGLVEAAGALVGFFAVQFSSAILPWTLAFSAGMMLYVISHEMIPEYHGRGHEKKATLGLFVGFVIMMILDVALSQ